MSKERRRMLMNMDDDGFEGVILYFNSNTSNGWFIEDNVNGDAEYYQIGDGEKIAFPPTASFVDQYVSISGSSIVNNKITIYMLPDIESEKGVKRRNAGLISVDLSKMPSNSRWYFWNGLTYSDLLTIIFPTKYKNQIIDLDYSYMNWITIPTTAEGIFRIVRFPNVNFLSTGTFKHFRVLLLATGTTLDTIISNLPSNVEKGIAMFSTSIFSSVTSALKESLIAKNLEIRTFDGDMFEADWSL